MSAQLTSDAFIARLRKEAYDGLDVAGHTVDRHGWMDAKFVATLESVFAGRDRAAPLTIVEVGSWKGLGFSRASLIAVNDFAAKQKIKLEVRGVVWILRL